MTETSGDEIAPVGVSGGDTGRPQAAVGDISRVSTASDGTQGNAAVALSGAASFSPDGTKILFASSASNLVAGDTNGAVDIFVKDLSTGAITRVSTNDLGQEAGSYSADPVFSPDGTKVAFYSNAANLVANDTNGSLDVFVKDLVTGAVTRVSTDSAGGQLNQVIWSVAAFSPDGTKLMWTEAFRIWIKDLDTGVLTMVSTDNLGNAANGQVWDAVFSPDGTRIAFRSGATNLVAGDTNGVDDVFIKDLSTGAVTRVSTDGAGGQSNGASYSIRFSPDGTRVIFASNATNLVAGDTNGQRDIFIKDLATGAVTRVSTTAAGDQTTGGASDQPFFSPDGAKILFASNATNLVDGDTNAATDVFIKNLATGALLRVSKDSAGGESNGASSSARFSPDGARVLFVSSASNLVAGDTNGVYDLFVKEPGDPVAAATSGDDTLTGTAGADTLDGLGGNDVLDGGDGDDTLSGGDGNDRLRGGTGSDAMSGGTGDDFYVVDDVGDTVIENPDEGNDTVQSRISWTLGANVENLILGSAGGSTDGTGNELDNVLTGNSFANTLWGLDGNDTLVGGGGADVLYGGDDDDSLDGGNQDDQLYGGAGTDVLLGGAGNDLLDGGTGDDTMTGGAGNDTYYVDSAADTVTELAGQGTDTVVVVDLLSYSLPDNVENLTLTGSATFGTGNGLNNLISGSAQDNQIFAGGGNDTVYGGVGADNLYGDDGNDLLFGEDGDDILLGGAGSDRMTGGAGADRFAFSSGDVRQTGLGQVADKDQILDLDFSAGDIIDLSKIDANVNNADPFDAFTFVRAFTGVAGQAVLTYQAGTNTTLLRLDVDGDGKADLLIQINGDVTGTKDNLYTGAGDTDGGWIL